MARRTSPSIQGASGLGNAEPDRGEWIDMPVGWESDSATATGELREGRLRQEDDYAHRMVPLRNGAGEMVLAKAALAKAELSRLLNYHPALFQALRALAEGRRKDVSREQVQALRKEGVVMGSGRVRGDLQMVWKASYEETADGRPSIVEPYDTSHPDDAEAVRRFLDEMERGTRKGRALAEQRLREMREGQGRAV
jgi:hypothetical protein